MSEQPGGMPNDPYPDGSEPIAGLTSADVFELPMFPLGSVLFPSMILPLRIFEPRYQTMVRRCLDGDRRFGVAMIDRGSEVGGGDVRSMIGCVSTILQEEEQDDGQWFLVCVGTGRVRIHEWLDDDPHPVARVSMWADDDPTDELLQQVRALEAPFRTVLALATELDEWSVPLTIELSEDPILASYQMSAVSPFGSFDRQQLLAAETAAARVDLLGELFADADLVLRARLGG